MQSDVSRKYNLNCERTLNYEKYGERGASQKSNVKGCEEKKVMLSQRHLE